MISERDRFSWKCVSEGDLVQLNVFGELRQGDKATQQWYRVMGFVEKVTFRDTNVKRICEHNAELGNDFIVFLGIYIIVSHTCQLVGPLVDWLTVFANTISQQPLVGIS